MVRPALRSLLGGGLALSVLALTACGGGDASSSSSSSSASAKGNLVVGAQPFTEAAIMQQMYAQLLTKAGYTVTTKSASRDIYTKALESGQIDVVPEYVGAMANFLKKGSATNDLAATLTSLRASAAAQGLKVLDPAKAQDQDGYFVTKEYAAKNGNLTNLSQLSGKKVTLVADGFCKDNSSCAGGLRTRYGIDLTLLPGAWVYGSAQLKAQVKGGKAQLGQSSTTDATLEPQGFVLLKDDKAIQPVQNIVPVVNAKDAGSAPVAAALTVLDDVLTTEDLTALNAKVDAERRKPEDVAKDYLSAKGLLG